MKIQQNEMAMKSQYCIVIYQIVYFLKLFCSYVAIDNIWHRTMRLHNDSGSDNTAFYMVLNFYIIPLLNVTDIF